MSSISFTKVTKSNPEEVCGICLQPSGTDFVVHDGGKDNTKIHPFDVKCLKTWFAEHSDNPTCPTCRAKVNTQSLFSWKEKLVTELKNLSPIAMFIGANIALVATTLIFGIAADSMGYSLCSEGEVKIVIVASAGLVVWAHRRGICGMERAAELNRMGYYDVFSGQFIPSS
jgi:hypothetical protein